MQSNDSPPLAAGVEAWSLPALPLWKILPALGRPEASDLPETKDKGAP